MVETVLDIVSWVLVVIGCVFLVAGGVGLLRLPGFYARLHAASLIDTLGVLAPMVALALQMETWQGALKILLVFALLIVTSPSAVHALARAARRNESTEAD